MLIDRLVKTRCSEESSYHMSSVASTRMPGTRRMALHGNASVPAIALATRTHDPMLSLRGQQIVASLLLTDAIFRLA